MRTARSILLPLSVIVASLAGWARADRPMSEIDALIAAAAPGATVEIAAGVYQGHLVIRTPVVLDGRGEVTLDGGGSGTVVEVLCPDVTLRGLTVRGSGKSVSGEPAAIRVLGGPVVIEDNRIEDALFGIDLRESPGSVVARNTIRGKDLPPGRRGDGIRLWWSHGCVIEDNDVRGSRDMVFWYSEDLRVRNNRVRDSRYGLHFMYSHDTVLSENRLERNSVGIYLMYSNRIRLVGNSMLSNRGASGYGIGLKDCDEIVVENNALLSNRVGAYIDNSPSSVDSHGLIERNMIAFNEIGVLATPNTHDVVLTGNAFVENEEQVAVHGRGDLSNNLFARDGTGNFWTDYAGFDRDGDGLGDLEHAPRSLFSSLLARDPNLRIFVHSPAQQAVEFTARALPELRPTPVFSDPSPLSRPPEISSVAVGAPAARVGTVVFGIGLLIGSVALCWCLCRQPSMPVVRAGERGVAA